MNKTIIIVLMGLFSVGVVADDHRKPPKGSPPVIVTTTDNDRIHQGQQQGQHQGQLQGQQQKTSSNSSSYSNSTSNSGGNVLTLDAGSHTTSSTAAGGSGGNANSDISVDASNDYDTAAAGAAAIFAQVCQQGVSAQGKGGGFSNLNADAVCQRIDLYRTWIGVYEFEKSRNYRCTHTQSKALEKKHCSQMYTEEMAYAYSEAMRNIKEAQEMVDLDEYPAKVDNVAGRLLRPLGIIAALIIGF